MKIQFLNGGLANQVFQYIFARYYELSHPGSIMYMDDTYFSVYTVHNGYELEKVFGLKPHMLSECFDSKVWNFILEERKQKSVPQIFLENNIDIQMIAEAITYKQFNPFNGDILHVTCNEYHPEILDISQRENIYYHGYWLNKHWFEKYKDIFLQELRFPEITDEKNLAYRELIRSSRSVCVHIRRGDYVDLEMAFPPEIYRLALEKFLSTAPGPWHLFVFSDDIGWCREHAQQLGFRQCPEVTYMEGNIQGKNYIDLQLMTLCKGMIVSNSAFSFLAALLNTRKEHWLNMGPNML